MMYDSVRLGDVAEFVRGITFTPSDVDERDREQGIGVMRTKNVQRTLDLSDVWTIDETFVKNEKQYLTEGDLLVSSANSWNLVGKAVWVPKLDFRSTFGGFISVLRKTSEKLDNRYLFHWFISERTQTLLRSLSNKTTNISNLNLRRALELSIPLPPLAEQRRIAEQLDTADRILRLRERAIAKLDQLAQSVFMEMFGDPVRNPNKWTLAKLNDLCITKGQYGAGLSAIDFDPSHPRYIRITDIDEYGCLNEKMVSPSGSDDEWTDYYLRDGDVLIARSGATVGKTYLHRNCQQRCVYAGYLIRFSPNPTILQSEFLFALTRTAFYRQWVEAKKKVVAQPNINAKQYGDELIFPVPPIEHQKKFARFYASMEELKNYYQHSISKNNILLAALQHQSFSIN